MTRRRASLALFVAGVILAVGFGCLVAAYDLWGGIPRGLRGTARAVFTAAALLVVGGGVGWLTSWPADARLRAAARAAVLLAVVALVSGGGLFYYYGRRLKTSRLVCAPALVAPTRASREAALREGLGPLFPVIDPSGSCLELLREQRELAATGHCPSFVMVDVPCTCGDSRWSTTSAPPCATGPTACQYRDGHETLGCAEHGSQYTLEEAQKAEAEVAASKK